MSCVFRGYSDFSNKNNNSDMQDRMCMRNVVGSALKWPIPKYSDPSSSVAWRARCGVIDASDTENDMDSESDDKYLCRSLRCFLAWKT